MPETSEELKACPNRKCKKDGADLRLDRFEFMIRVECLCGMTGPHALVWFRDADPNPDEDAKSARRAEAEARSLWNELPRDADSVATAEMTAEMTDEGQAFRALRSPDLVGSAEALEACRFLGDRDGLDVMTMPGGAAAKGGPSGAVRWGLERLQRQAGRTITEGEEAVYAGAMTLALLDVACG